MYCKKCKKEIPENSKYCCYCGCLQKTQRSKKVKGNGRGCAYKLPNGTWRAEITVDYSAIDGKLKRKTKTKSGFKTKKEAEEYIPWLKVTPVTVKPTITFAKMYEEWVPLHEEKVSKSTMDCYKSAYNQFSEVHHAIFADIKTKALQRCIDNCSHGTRTKENMKALGTLLYKYAIENDIIEKNYASFLYVKKEVTERRGFFTLEDRKNLWSHAKDDDKRVKHVEFVLCLMYTGFRPNELLKLKDTDFHGDYLVGGSKTAKGINRIVTISPMIKPFVEALAAKEGYIFSLDGTKISDKRFYKIYYKVLEECGIPRKEPYCCRHTFATMMKEVDAPDTDKMELIGHASMEMTAHYTHTDITSLKRITDNIGTMPLDPELPLASDMK